MKPNKRGEVATVVLLVLAVGGLVFMAVRPKATHGESKRAQASTEATQQLEQATTRQGAEAAASIVKIGEANAQAPDSPAKSFISREIPVALAKLPVPDAAALIEAEKRKAAVLAGKLEEAQRLYDQAMKRADTLAQEKAEALAARREADLKLEQAAALTLGAERQRNQLLIIAAVAVGLWLWVKFTHLSPGRVADAITYVRKDGDTAERAFDTVTTPFQQSLVRLFSKLK